MNGSPTPQNRKPIRWWPAVVIITLATAALAFVRLRPDYAFQQRNIGSTSILVVATALLLLWWLFFSRARGYLRLLTLAGLILLGVGARMSFRITGVTGDLLPIIEPRWKRTETASKTPDNRPETKRLPGDFPQFLGPDRNGVFAGPTLATDWSSNPPVELWRTIVGPAWSGFAVVGSKAITQEQSGEDELVVCRDLFSGADLWRATNSGRYATTIAGEGPRTTPTVVGDRVFTLGAAGWLQCLDLATGRARWGTNILSIAKSGVPAWGFAGSPLFLDGRLIVSAGGGEGRSLLIFDASTGQLTASDGSSPANYGSPFFARLAGVPQVVIFNEQDISSHDPISAKLLWQRPWGTKYPLVAMPVQVTTNRIFISAGYGVGAELVQVDKDASGKLSPTTVWASKRIKAKFSNPVMRGDFAYGLDDGILACVDLKDGSQRWKEGRYGHGQSLLIDDLLLLMAETGELVLLRPTPDAPGELSRHRVFDAKTWNPIALAGDLLLVRNDREAVCLRLGTSLK